MPFTTRVVSLRVIEVGERLSQSVKGLLGGEEVVAECEPVSSDVRSHASSAPAASDGGAGVVLLDRVRPVNGSGLVVGHRDELGPFDVEQFRHGAESESGLAVPEVEQLPSACTEG